MTILSCSIFNTLDYMICELRNLRKHPSRELISF